ncbi:DUF3139 domain-containing protein [Brevibacillus agri]|uniref:DUF3139 domain-containing protein n=1 Tax=Brevibacillus agri TaxID=51101 RepID=UPI0002A4E0AF|nr:hypothetical protein D478_21368 [Brevibacillus agri BAB-2500]MBG9566355.1 hypothetical protein [Brevibacillus agri]
MKKILWLAVVILVASPLVVYFEWIVGGYPWVKNEMEMDIRNYFTSRGYERESVKDIQVLYNRKLGNYTAKVIFRGEEDNIYYYNYIHGKITQRGLTSSDRKNARHLEK